jgi:hypothetical protein
MDAFFNGYTKVWKRPSSQAAESPLLEAPEGDGKSLGSPLFGCLGHRGVQGLLESETPIAATGSEVSQRPPLPL